MADESLASSMVNDTTPQRGIAAMAGEPPAAIDAGTTATSDAISATSDATTAATEAISHDALLTVATDQQWKIHAAIQDAIRFADTKAGAMLAANGAMLATAFGSLRDNHTALLDQNLMLWLLCLAFGLATGSVFCSLICIVPRTRSHGAGSLIYFGTIAGHESYQTAALELGQPQKAFEELSAQVQANAKIARRKHALVALAVGCFAGAIACIIVTGLLALKTL